MPATRKARTLGGPAAKGGQSTLSFGGRNRVTKNTLAPSKLSKDTTNNVKTENINAEPTKVELGHVTSKASVVAQAKIELSKPKTEEEILAGNVMDTQIKRYWQAREAERITPRVHLEELSTEEKILRLFDMSSQYGPCIGIARMKRWVRANKLGLNPPIEVLAVLLKEEGKGNTKIERAHVDELMSSNPVVGEA